MGLSGLVRRLIGDNNVAKIDRFFTKLYFLSALILVLLGLFLSRLNGYGSDNDTYGMIGTFLNVLDTGTYNSSRYTGNPFAELFIGFTSFYFGSQILKILIFLFFVLGIMIFYYSFDRDIFSIKFSGYLILCLTSCVLFFDNLEPMDYSIAFLFFSIGLYFRSINRSELMVLSFAFSIGTRISFLVFALVLITFARKERLEKRATELISLLIVSSLFYVPNMIANKLTFLWFDAKQPDEQGILGLIGRFGYKTWLSFGLICFFLLLNILIKNRAQILSNEKHKVILLLALCNFAIYLWIPSDRSYLQPSLIFIYYLISQYAGPKMILIVALLNLQAWFMTFSFFQFTFKFSEPCDPIYATSIKFSPTFEWSGEYRLFIDEGDLSRCFTKNFPDGIADSISRGAKLNR
jgi:hypothetical protein